MEGSTRGGKSAGFLPPCWLFVALGGKNFVKLLGASALRPDEGANERVESRNPRSRERQGLESAAAQCLHRCRSVGCAKGVRRSGAKGSWAHWQSAAGADPAASSGVPPETTLDCKLCEVEALA
eukprot:1831583-Pleurochrysis_carterae.AAC.1